MAMIFQPSPLGEAAEQGMGFSKALMDFQGSQMIQQARNVAAEHQMNMQQALAVLNDPNNALATRAVGGQASRSDGTPMSPNEVAYRQHMFKTWSNYLQNSGPTQVWRGGYNPAANDGQGAYETGRRHGVQEWPGIQPAPPSNQQQAVPNADQGGSPSNPTAIPTQIFDKRAQRKQQR